MDDRVRKPRPVREPKREEEVVAVSEVVEEVIVEVAPEPKPRRHGVVVFCDKLNVRKAPSKNAEIIAVIPKGAQVELIGDETFVDYYKVCLASGLEGYCMIGYIEVQK